MAGTHDTFEVAGGRPDSVGGSQPIADAASSGPGPMGTVYGRLFCCADSVCPPTMGRG